MHCHALHCAGLPITALHLTALHCKARQGKARQCNAIMCIDNGACNCRLQTCGNALHVCVHGDMYAYMCSLCCCWCIHMHKQRHWCTEAHTVRRSTSAHKRVQTSTYKHKHNTHISTSRFTQHTCERASARAHSCAMQLKARIVWNS